MTTTRDVPDGTARAEATVHWAGALIRAANDRLRVLETAIRAAQPVRNGAVIMMLKSHEPPCMGCPHPHWLQWRGHPQNTRHQWLGHPVRYPLARLPRWGANPHLRALVREACAITAKRQRVINHLSPLAQMKPPPTFEYDHDSATFHVHPPGDATPE